MDKSRDLCEKSMAYFHIYTKGLEDREIFNEDADFVAGMNLLAVTVFGCNIVMLAFVLMSNHFHFVVRCTRKQAEDFIRLYKCYIARYLRLKYGDVKFLRRIKTSVALIDDADEGLKKLIAYVLNNPVKAGINCVPQGYEWSSARCYFNSTDFSRDTACLNDYGVRKLRSILHTHKKLPAGWRINTSGYIIPQSFVDSMAVENLFVRSRSFEFFLSRSLALRKGINENVSFSDNLVMSAMKELLEKKYDVLSLEGADDFLRRNIVKDLKGRFSASTKQIARVMGISVKEVLVYLE